MPDVDSYGDLLTRARRAAALAPAERDRLVSELAKEVGRLQRERDAYLNLCVVEDTGGMGRGWYAFLGFVEAKYVDEEIHDFQPVEGWYDRKEEAVAAVRKSADLDDEGEEESDPY